MWTSCSTDWVAEAEQIVAVLLPGMANVVTLVATLQGGNISAQELRAVQSAGAQAEADLRLLQSLIGEYKKADAAMQPGLLNQMQVDMSAVEANLNRLPPALHIKDAATQAKVGALVAVLIAEVQSVQAIFPIANAGASRGAVTMRATRGPTNALLSAKEFVSSYNAIMTGKIGRVEFDRTTAQLRIHLHGKLARLASAGILN
jgi:hypothetical protein